MDVRDGMLLAIYEILSFQITNKENWISVDQIRSWLLNTYFSIFHIHNAAAEQGRN